MSHVQAQDQPSQASCSFCKTIYCTYVGFSIFTITSKKNSYYRTVPLAIIVQILMHHLFLVKMDSTQILANRQSAIYAQKVISVPVLVINQHHVLLGILVCLVLAHVPCAQRGMSVLMVSIFPIDFRAKLSKF